MQHDAQRGPKTARTTVATHCTSSTLVARGPVLFQSLEEEPGGGSPSPSPSPSPYPLPPPPLPTHIHHHYRHHQAQTGCVAVFFFVLPHG